MHSRLEDADSTDSVSVRSKRCRDIFADDIRSRPRCHLNKQGLRHSGDLGVAVFRWPQCDQRGLDQCGRVNPIDGSLRMMAWSKALVEPARVKSVRTAAVRTVGSNIRNRGSKIAATSAE